LGPRSLRQLYSNPRALAQINVETCVPQLDLRNLITAHRRYQVRFDVELAHMKSVGLPLLLLCFVLGGCVRHQATANFSNAKPQPTKSVALTEVDLTINGVRVGTAEREVVARLGKAMAITNDSDMDDCAGGYHRLFTYEGLIVDLLGNEKRRGNAVTRMDLTSSQWETARGVNIGDPISKVREIFGEPISDEEECLFYAMKDNDGWVNFYYKDGTVVRAVVSVTLC
jgi:hypothetical protein